MTATATANEDLLLDEIKRLMKRKKVGTRELIEQTGISKNTVYDYLAGKRATGSDKVSAILGYLRNKGKKP